MYWVLLCLQDFLIVLSINQLFGCVKFFSEVIIPDKLFIN